MRILNFTTETANTIGGTLHCPLASSGFGCISGFAFFENKKNKFTTFFKILFQLMRVKYNRFSNLPLFWMIRYSFASFFENGLFWFWVSSLHSFRPGQLRERTFQQWDRISEIRPTSYWNIIGGNIIFDIIIEMNMIYR